MMEMQKKGWMDSIHFMEWMEYFIHKIDIEERLSHNKSHLLILDGYKSNINIDMLMKIRDHYIDIIKFLSLTGHKLKPLDKACFRSLKVAFRTYRDLWNIKNSGRKCKKGDLVKGIR